MAEQNIVWEKPEGCTCTYEKSKGASKPLVIFRVNDPACPMHGELNDVLAYLETVILDYLKTIPGGERVSPVMAGRILRALVPALLKDETLAKLLAAQGNMPVPPADTPTEPTEGEV